MTDGEGGPGISRRAFLKRMAAIGFAVPVISSFALDAAASESGHLRSDLANQTGSTVPIDEYYATYGNQSPPYLSFANQYLPNQYAPNQAATAYQPNQYFGNQV